MSKKSSLVSFWIVIASIAIALSLPAQTFSPWSNVENLGTGVNTADADSCLFVTRSGLSLYFGSTRPGGAGGLDLYVSQRASIDDPWGAPQSLGPILNTAGDDHLAFITPDGHTMIFASTRPGGLGGNDLYSTFRRNAADDFGWEAPVLIAGINSAGQEYGPWGFVDRTGRLTMCFTSDRPGGAGGLDIYSTTLQADGSFSAPELVEELSSSAGDLNPTIREDGLELFLSSNRAGGLGGIDIWVSTRGSVSEPWSAPVNAGAEVNSSANDLRGGTFGAARDLYFYSARSGGQGGLDLYRAMRTQTTIIPIVGSTTGAGGQTFRTVAHLANPGDTAISGRLVFHPAGTPAGAGDPSIDYELTPYESQTIADLMGSFGFSGIGSLEIVPDTGRPPVSAFRIDNGGSVVVSPVDAENLLSTGSVTAMKMPSDLNRFRTNIAIRTLDAGATIWICQHEPDGTFIRGDTHVFPPNYLVQLPVADLLGGEVDAEEMVMFTVNAGSAVVLGSTVANSGHTSTLQILKRVAD